MRHTVAVLRLALLLLVLLVNRAIGPARETSQQVCLRGVVAGRPDASVVRAHRLGGHDSSDGSFTCGPVEGPDANLDVLHVLGTEDFTISAELMLVRPVGRDSATSLDFISPTGVDYLGLDSGPAPDTFFTQGVHWPDQTIKSTRTPVSGQWFNLTATRASGVLAVHVDSKHELSLPMEFALNGFALRPWRSAVHVRSLTVCAPAIPAPPPPAPPPAPPEVTVFVHGEGGCTCIGIPALILALQVLLPSPHSPGALWHYVRAGKRDWMAYHIRVHVSGS